MATLIGMLISDGKLKLSDTVADILPKYADLPNTKLITVEQLLDMKSGLLWNEWGGREGNQLQFEFNDDTVTITMSPRSLNGAQPYIIPAHLGETWLHTPVTPVDNRWQKSGAESMRAARAQWLDNNTLQFEAVDVD